MCLLAIEMLEWSKHFSLSYYICIHLNISSMYSKHNFIDECMYKNNQWKVETWFSSQTHFLLLPRTCICLLVLMWWLTTNCNSGSRESNPRYDLHAHHIGIWHGAHANKTFIYIKLSKSKKYSLLYDFNFHFLQIGFQLAGLNFNII